METVSSKASSWLKNEIRLALINLLDEYCLEKVSFNVADLEKMICDSTIAFRRSSILDCLSQSFGLEPAKGRYYALTVEYDGIRLQKRTGIYYTVTKEILTK